MKIAEIYYTTDKENYCVYFEHSRVKAHIRGAVTNILADKMFANAEEAKKALEEDFEKYPRENMVLKIEDGKL